MQPGRLPAGPEPKLIAGRPWSLAACRDAVTRLTRAIHAHFAEDEAVGLFVEPSPEFCFALAAIPAAGKTCVPFDFRRHHDNLGDLLDQGRPLIAPGAAAPFAGARFRSVASLLDAPPGRAPFRLTRSPNLFATRLGLVRLEFGRGFLSNYLRRLDAWAGRSPPARLLTGLAPLDFIGILELFWFFHRPGRIRFVPADFPDPGDGERAQALVELVRNEDIGLVQCAAADGERLERRGSRVRCLLMGDNEDVDSERFRRLMR